MFRLRLIAMASIVLALSVLAFADDKVSPFYALPADGAWVEYEWTRPLPDGKEERGKLRFSSVGSKEVDGARCRWLEIKVEAKHGEQTKWECRKLLVAEKAFTEGKPLTECVLDCFHQDNAGPAVVRLSKKHTEEFLRLNLPTGERALKEVQAKEEITTGLGKFTARHVSAVAKDGDKQQEYNGWQTLEVPFGVAKFEIHEQRGSGPARLVFTAAAKRSGVGAKSEVNETAAK